MKQLLVLSGKYQISSSVSQIRIAHFAKNLGIYMGLT